MRKIMNKKFEIFCLAMSIMCLSVCIIRAVSTCITGDEAFTYMNYVYDNPFKVFNLLINKGAWANNHILNSFLISVLTSAFKLKYNEFLIRIPSISFYVLYLFYSYKLVKNYKGKYMYFTLLNLNYGMNEFFGLARGYGMCSALVLAGIYYLKEYFENKKEIKVIVGFSLLTLACYANTIALLIVAAYFIPVFIDLIKEKRILKFAKKYIISILIIGICLLLSLRYHFMVSADGLPLYGGNKNFFDDVLVSMFNYYGFIKMTKWIVYLFIIVFTGLILTNIKMLKRPLIYVMPLYFILMVVMVKVSDTLMPTGRVLLPSMVLLSVCLIEIIENSKINMKIFAISEIVSIFGLSVLFISNIDCAKTRDWKDDYKIKEISYDAYRKKDNKKIEKLIGNDVARFYREKILKEKKYDILKK